MFLIQCDDFDAQVKLRGERSFFGFIVQNQYIFLHKTDIFRLF